MELLSKKTVQEMNMYEMADYANDVCIANHLKPWFVLSDDDRLFDIDDPDNEIMDNSELFDLLLMYNKESTDLQNRIFTD